MKNFIWIALSLFTTMLSAQSQHIFRDGELTKGHQVSSLSGMGSFGMLSDDSTIFQIDYSRKANKLLVASYNFQTLGLTDQQELEFSYQNNPLTFVHATMFMGELVVFTEFYNSKDDKKYVFAQTINKKTLQPLPNLTKVAEATRIKQNFQMTWAKFIFKFSANKDVLAIFSQSPQQRQNFESVSVSTIDKNCKVIWSKNIELPYSEKMFAAQEYCVNSKGDVFIIGRLFEEKPRTKVKGKPNYVYKVLRYNADGSHQEYNIQVTDKFINDLHAYISNDEVLVLAGFYNHHNGYNKISGTFYTSFDLKTHQLVSANYRNFDAALLSLGMSSKKLKPIQRREARGKPIVLKNYQFRQLVQRPDGGVVLIGEQYYFDTGSSKSNRTSIHYYNDILVANISPSGVIQWVNVIPKSQSCMYNCQTMSFVFAAHNDKVYFIFNDHAHNIPFNQNRKASSAPIESDDSVVSIVSIDAEGKQVRQELSRYVDTQTAIIPSASYQISPKDVILFASPIKKSRYASGLQRLTFK